jgi:hypothetical protein
MIHILFTKIAQFIHGAPNIPLHVATTTRRPLAPASGRRERRLTEAKKAFTKAEAKNKKRKVSATSKADPSPAAHTASTPLGLVIRRV